jgi:hypothetical protein
MKTSRPHVPVALPVTAIILLLLGIAANFGIQSYASPQQLAQNVLLSAIPFILMFIAIILLYATLIIWLSSIYSDRISPGAYRVGEVLTIGGIVLGIVMIFQPWIFLAYPIGFVVLLLATLSFILWSHIHPKQTMLYEAEDQF